MIYPEARVQQALYFASLRVLVIHTKRPESDTHLSHPMRAHHVDFLGCLPSTARSAVPCLLPPIAVNLSVLKYRSSQNFLSISLALLTPILIADQIRFHFTFHFRSFRIFLCFLSQKSDTDQIYYNYYEMMQRVVDNIIAVTKE